jgi:hypothetical protein
MFNEKAESAVAPPHIPLPRVLHSKDNHFRPGARLRRPALLLPLAAGEVGFGESVGDMSLIWFPSETGPKCTFFWGTY